MPSLPSLEEIERGRATLDGLASQAGRDPASIEILAFGRPGQFKDREAIKEVERAGAGRVTVWLDQTEGDEALEVMEEIAGRVLP